MVDLSQRDDDELRIVKKGIEQGSVNPLSTGYIVAPTQDEVHVWEVELNEREEGTGKIGSLDLESTRLWSAPINQVEAEFSRRGI